jgi:hypothetical protein
MLCTHGHWLVCRASLHLHSVVHENESASARRSRGKARTDLVVHAAPLLALSALERVRLGLLRRGGLRLEQVLGDELAVLGFALFRRHVLDRHSSEFSSFSQHSLASRCPPSPGRLTLGSISYSWTMLISPLTTSSRKPGLLAAFRLR